MHRRGQPITIDTLPNSHERMRGTYSGETDDGCRFEIYVNSGPRRAGGNDLMRAHIRSLSQGRPMSNSDFLVHQDEIYILIGRQHRKDIKINPNGTYGHGSIHGRTFRDIVENMIRAFAPKTSSKTDEDGLSGPAPSLPKPF
jgi:hypothetical protein